MENPCFTATQRDSTNESPLPTYPDLCPQVRDILPNLKRIASRHARRVDWLTYDDALQTLLWGAHNALKSLDASKTGPEQGRYLVMRSENWLKTRVDLDAPVSCPSQVTAARNRVRSGSGTEADIASVGFLAFSRESFDESGDWQTPWQNSPVRQPDDEALVSWAFAQLPPLDAAVLELVKLFSFSYQETADILQISVNRVQSRIKAATKKLGSLLGDAR